MKEIWKDIPGSGNLYQISNAGNVRRNGKLIRPCLLKNGYLAFNISHNSAETTTYVHRCVAQAFVPNPDNKQQVNHINGDKTDNVASNLEWVTKSQNAIHSLYTLKNSHGAVKVKPVKCVETGEVFDSAAKAHEKYGISARHIGAVARGDAHKHTAGGYHWEFL